MLFSVLPLIHALSLLTSAAAAAAGPEGGGALADHTSLVQGGLSWLLSTPARAPKKFALFFDGTSLAYSGTLYEILRDGVLSDGNQTTFYERGVTTLSGHGVRIKGMNGLNWLAAQYQPGDEIFLYGLSRGCLTARWLQGMLYKYGLPKEVLNLQAFPWSSVEEHIRRHDTWKNVDIAVLGCIDGVLRTVCSNETQESLADMSYMHQAIAPTVRNVLHAMALEELSGFTYTHDFIVPEGTHEEQVWFAGDHASLGKDNELVGRWLAERSQELAGIRLKERFLQQNNVDIFMTTPLSTPMAAHAFSDMVIRDPLMCRKEIYGGRRIKVHASVRDRMLAARGWEPLTTCCSPEAFDEENVEWVTTPGYQNARKPVQPQWITVKLQFENITDEDLETEDLHVMVTTTSGSYRIAGVREYKASAPSRGNWTVQDALTIPWHNGILLVSLVRGPCPSLLECSWDSVHVRGEDFRVVDRFRLSLYDMSGDRMLGEGKIRATIELLMDDDSARRVMNATRPRCEWVKRFLNSSTSMCHNDFRDIPQTCEDLRSQVTTGSLHSASAPSAAGGSLLLLVPMLLAVALQ